MINITHKLTNLWLKLINLINKKTFILQKDEKKNFGVGHLLIQSVKKKSFIINTLCKILWLVIKMSFIETKN